MHRSKRPATWLVLLLLAWTTACAATAVEGPPQEPVPGAPPGDAPPAQTATPVALPTMPDTATPRSTPPPIATPEPLTMTPSPAVVLEHVAQPGESLWSIAQLYGVTVEALKAANGLAGDDLLAGSRLTIPGAPGAAIPEAAVDPAATSPPPATAATATGSDGTTATPDGIAEAAGAAGTRIISQNGVPCPPAGELFDAEGGLEIGRSTVCDLPLLSYRFGDGPIPLVVVGGIHGGYEWNTILLAYDLLDDLNAGTLEIPPALSVTIIPNANPDGLYAVSQKAGRFTEADLYADTVPGRFNGRFVDLNRNWDCQWQPVATWRDTEISGGAAPFSEQENRVLRDTILQIEPAAVVFLHSAARGVFASGCEDTDPDSRALADVYGEASGYPVYDSFQHYEITGDAGDWLASEQGIPSISIELSNHEDRETDRNERGLRALMAHLAAAAAASE